MENIRENRLSLKNVAVGLHHSLLTSQFIQSLLLSQNPMVVILVCWHCGCIFQHMTSFPWRHQTFWGSQIMTDGWWLGAFAQNTLYNYMCTVLHVWTILKKKKKKCWSLSIKTLDGKKKPTLDSKEIHTYKTFLLSTFSQGLNYLVIWGCYNFGIYIWIQSLCLKPLVKLNSYEVYFRLKQFHIFHFTIE